MSSDPELATRAPESDAMEDQTPSATQPPANTSPDTTTQPSDISATDSVAQTGPTMGHDCTSDRPAPINTGSTGTISQLGDVDTYISLPADYPSTPAKLLLLLTGGTGIHSLNNQLQADRYAAAGYLVVMPDQFAGDTAPNSTNRVTSPTGTTFPDPESQTPASPSLLDRIKLGFADTAKSFVLDMWLARQTPEKVLPRLLRVLKAAQDEYADAIAHADGIYAVGYCFGARYVLILAGDNVEAHPAIAPAATTATATDGATSVLYSAGGVIGNALTRLPSIPGLGGAKNSTSAAADDEEAQPSLPPTDPSSTTSNPAVPAPTASRESNAATPAPSTPLPRIRAAAIAHGTLITREDVRGVSPSVPLYVVAVQDDPLFPEEVLEAGRKAWASNAAATHVEVFRDVPHGFAVVGEYEFAVIQRALGWAWGGMRGWLDGR